MRKIFLLLSVIAVIAAQARTIATPGTHGDFMKKKAAVADNRYFKIFDKKLTDDQRSALEFLYAYMALPDITDYPGDFYLENVNTSLRAMDEMPWGKIVPDREFRHFVLPVRINNENMDTSRIVFYNELRNRVKNLSMTDAVLEVNRWCHEKVTYQPSDGRTSAPLASVRSAIGRCGEESTFAVAALRAVGIPARQVYTPRWAHTDDNHAWVEAWADGKWHFLGACEPEAVLNLGWFNAPASRGMMMHTKAFGSYDGPEEVLETTPCYNAINVTSNYAPVSNITARIIDRQGKPVKDAIVNFSIYNYSEYYPIGSKKTGDDGVATLTAGRGDIIVHATDGTNFGMAKASVGRDKEVTVTLDLDPKSNITYEWDLTPPAPSPNMPYVSPEKARMNEILKAREDSIRNAYTATFLTVDKAKETARRLGMDIDRTAKVLVETRGNHPTVVEFLTALKPQDRALALDMLEAMAEKDRRDITMENLVDHIATPAVETPLYKDYILNPRIANENLTPYKSQFGKIFSKKQLKSFAADPKKLISLISKEIKTESKYNPLGLCMTPLQSWNHKKTDPRSRSILFVAIARTAGIPARIDPVTGKTQWADNSGNWNDVEFETVSETENTPQGTLRMHFTPAGRIDNPNYYSHFSLSKLYDGEPVQMGYPENGTYASLFAKECPMDEGQYMLTSGQRMADGGVLARTTVFTIEPGKTTDVDLVMRRDTTRVQVIGNFNSENRYFDMDSQTEKSLLSTSGRGYYILALLRPNHEPSIHALNDLSARKAELEQTGRTIFLIFPDKESAALFDKTQYPNLPSNVVFGIDTTGAIAAELPEKEMPVVIIGDTFNRVVFISSGYTISLGDQLVDTMHKIEE